MTAELKKATAERLDATKLQEEVANLRQQIEDEQRQHADKISKVEKELDDERRSLVSDLSRSKREVLKLMQVGIGMPGNEVNLLLYQNVLLISVWISFRLDVEF